MNSEEWSVYLSLSPEQLLDASLNYVFHKQWNQDFTELLPLVLSKIIKKRINIFKIINEKSFEQYDISYDCNFSELIYIMLKDQHYDSIILSHKAGNNQRVSNNQTINTSTKKKKEKLTTQTNSNNTKRKKSPVKIDEEIKVINFIILSIYYYLFYFIIYYLSILESYRNYTKAKNRPSLFSMHIWYAKISKRSF